MTAMSKLNMYSRRGTRLLVQSRVYQAQLDVLTRQKISAYDAFVLNTIKAVEAKIAELKHQSDVCRAKGDYLLGKPVKLSLIKDWNYYINLHKNN